MIQRELKVFLTPKGLELLDPGYEHLPFIKKICKNFKIQSIPSPLGFIPLFIKAKQIFIPKLSFDDLSRTNTRVLWEIHNSMTRGDIESLSNLGTLNLLDLKIELAKREIQECLICGRNCRVNRFNQIGSCGLNDEAYYNDLYIHVREEPPITPCAVIRLSGCGLRCVFCQAPDTFEARKGKRLDFNLWKELRKNAYFEKAVALQWAGGNPDESVYSILKCLKNLPDSFRLPIVWNNNGYAESVVYRLLDQVVDVWLTDLKYGNNECGLKLSGIKNYWDVATEGIKDIIRQNSKAIIRHLLLPGHLHCCTKKILDWISNYRHLVWISLIDNYIPNWKALQDPQISRMVSDEEISEAKELIRFYGLRDIFEIPIDFWS